MSVNSGSPMSPEEYLARETEAEYKSEYRHGETVAMTGASRRHVLIATNVISELNRQLKGRPCEVYHSDMRLKVQAAGLYTYPDVMVLCGKPEFADGRTDTVLNPILIVEILSPSTEAYDRGEKFTFYQKISTLREYVLIDQDRVLVECFTRRGDAWTGKGASTRGGTIRLRAIDCSLDLDEVYDKVHPQ